VHLFNNGIGDAILLHESKDDLVFFCHKVMHLLIVLGEQRFGSICNGTCAIFAHSLQPHLSSISKSFWAILGVVSFFSFYYLFKKNHKLKKKRDF
jgi:hypothetical protein